MTLAQLGYAFFLFGLVVGVIGLSILAAGFKRLEGICADDTTSPAPGCFLSIVGSLLLISAAGFIFASLALGIAGTAVPS